jgi:hypothetical protein
MEARMEDGQVIVHVRFAPDGTVREIGERPAGATATAWFNRLSNRAASSYQPLSGGRGLFRLTRGEIDALKAGAAQ